MSFEFYKTDHHALYQPPKFLIMDKVYSHICLLLIDISSSILLQNTERRNILVEFCNYRCSADVEKHKRLKRPVTASVAFFAIAKNDIC